MEEFASCVAPHSILLSGGAKGADKAFESGAESKGGLIETYLPWPKFEGILVAALNEPSKEAMEIGKYYHPRWSYLSQGAQKLIARNGHQILGKDLLSPVDRVVCWTPYGKASGGTGQGLRIAEDYEIPVFNLQRPADLEEILLEIS